MSRVYLSIGANLGSREHSCKEALQKLAELPQTELVAQSGLYETEPEGKTDQPAFINLAAAIETELSPERLLDSVQSIERALGREPSVRWGPRAIDLDILIYDRRVIESPGLRIPHPHMHLRRFVLVPLAEIAPDLEHPVMGHRISQLLRDLKHEGGWVRKF